MRLPEWYWERSDESALFPPTVTSFVDGWSDWYGVMEDGPPVVAEVFAREFVQNFADAADELKRNLDTEDIRAGLEFRFLRLSGPAAAEFLGVCGVAGHVDRYASMSPQERNDHRLAESGILEGEDEVSILVAVEQFATGMYGPWGTDGRAVTEQGDPIRRKMRDALVKPSGDKGSTTSLGSYGEGKKGVLLASRLRTLFAYTCFRPRTNEPEGDVSRRMLGVSYWRKHIQNAFEHTGLGLLGDESGEADRPKPFDDTAADELATSFRLDGLSVRDAAVNRDLGTTWVILEPAFEPIHLARAIERNWWPRLEEGRLEVTILDYDRQEVEVAPEQNLQLQPFLAAHALLTGKAPKQVNDVEKQVVVPTISDPAGRLALTVKLDDGGWSWADPDRNAHMLALVRGGMVIQYETFPRKRPKTVAPFVRGVFVSDDGRAAELLRNAEPPLHNHWVTDASTGNPKDSVDLARRTYAKLAEDVRDYAKRFRGEPPPQEYQFETFARFFNVGDRSLVTKPPDISDPPTRDPWVIQRPTSESLGADPSNATRVRVTARRKIALKPGWQDDDLAVAVRIGWRVLEEGDGGVDEPDLLDRPLDVVPAGFKLHEDGLYRGTLTKDEVIFEWTSAYFDGDWLTRAELQLSVEERADA